MSKATNPTTESSVTCGFYNSLNGDRKYNAVELSSIFDGIINDGVFPTIGDHFNVTAAGGSVINVGTGKAWFNHTWTDNNAILPITCEVSELLLDRIDAIVLEINASDNVRDNFIKYIKGVPSSTPAKPVLTQSTTIHQYPLCYIRRTAGVNDIKQTDITNVVGTDDTPYVIGIVQPVDKSDIENLLNNGLIGGRKTFSTDGKSITTIDSSNRKHIKVFSDDFLKCSSYLYNSAGILVGSMTKTFSTDGTVIDTTVNIV